MMTHSSIAPSDWDKPDWGAATKVHDWKNYAGPWLRLVWLSMSAEQKKAVAASLDDIAAREEWE